MKEMIKRITIVFLMLAVIFAFAPLPPALAADSDSGMLRASGLNKGKVLIDLSNGGKSYSINSVVVARVETTLEAMEEDGAVTSWTDDEGYDYYDLTYDGTEDIVVFWDLDEEKVTFYTTPNNLKGLSMFKPSERALQKLEQNGLDYYDTIAIAFSKEPIEEVKITQSSKELTWNGKNRSPGISLYNYAGEKLVKGPDSDYTISMAKNHHTVGKWTITINMTGIYEGTAKVTFNIIPKGTTLKKVTPGSKKFTATWGKQSTKMSSSVITGYQLQWSTSSTFASNNHTKKVKGYSKTSYTIDKSVWSGIQGGKKYYVRIRTYKTTSSGTYYSTWSNKLTVTTKK